MRCGILALSIWTLDTLYNIFRKLFQEVESPSLEIFKPRLDAVLYSLL